MITAPRFADVILRDDIEREISAINALRDADHRNLVHVLRHGWLDACQWKYFIDMELCQINLKWYIYEAEDWVQLACPRGNSATDEAMWWRSSEALRIMSQLADGLQYIHKLNQVHRDLKPANSMHPKVMSLSKCSSSLFQSKSMLEDNRFWFHVGDRRDG